MNATDSIREEVRETYSAIAERPEDDAPFPTGRSLAEKLGYPAALLDTLPVTAVDAFCGVSNVSLFAAIPDGSTVLDLGCGAGLDTLIAARRTGDTGKVYATDFSQAMLDRAHKAVAQARAANVELLMADAEQLPLADRSIDVAIVNGIFNLNPARERILLELARVMRPGGEVFAAELILTERLTEAERTDKTNWFS